LGCDPVTNALVSFKHALKVCKIAFGSKGLHNIGRAQAMGEHMAHKRICNHPLLRSITCRRTVRLRMVQHECGKLRKPFCPPILIESHRMSPIGAVLQIIHVAAVVCKRVQTWCHRREEVDNRTNLILDALFE
jgi:hypothetical protein